MPVTYFHGTIPPSGTLIPLELEAKISSAFLKLPWSWHFSPALEKELVQKLVPESGHCCEETVHAVLGRNVEDSRKANQYCKQSLGGHPNSNLGGSSAESNVDCEGTAQAVSEVNNNGNLVRGYSYVF